MEIEYEIHPKKRIVSTAPSAMKTMRFKSQNKQYLVFYFLKWRNKK